MLLWLDAPPLAQMSRRAHDLWSWRAGIYAFAADAAQSIVHRLGLAEAEAIAERLRELSMT